MSDSKIIDGGWTREFRAYGRDMKDVEAEARAYEEGIQDAAPNQYDVEFDHADDWIAVEVREKKAPKP